MTLKTSGALLDADRGVVTLEFGALPTAVYDFLHVGAF